MCYMKITNKKNIKKPEKYMSHIKNGEKAYIGLSLTPDVATKLHEIGFKNLHSGESLVPSPKLCRIANFNTNGREVPEKDKPKETVYRQGYWELTDWNGNHHSGTCYIPYLRYPRKLIPAPWIELMIVQSGENKFVIAGNAITKGQTDEVDIVHRINLLLAIFKQAEIFQENLEQYEVPRTVKLNWDILPKGEIPWETFKTHLAPIMELKSKGKKIIINERLETISKYNPDFHAIGENGYQGYIIFGFTGQNLYIFENAEYGNATYVFEGDWEQLSKMTKAEIIASNLYKHRLVHLDGWKQQIAGLFPHYDDKKNS